MGKRRIGGFVPAAFTEILIVVAISAVATAIFLPRFQATLRNGGIHECAAVIDSLVDGGEGGATCPISGRLYEQQEARWCCPTPREHSLEALCRAPSDPALAIAHRAPGRARLIVTGVLAGAPLIVFALFGILMLGMVISEQLEKRRKPPASP